MMKKQPEVTDATRQAIKDAFLTLYQQRSIDRISIRDIAQAAFVHRSTFYRYFSDIQDLLEQIEQEILDRVSASLRSLAQARELDDLVSHLDIVLSTMKEDAPVIYRLTGPNGDMQFRDRLRAELRHYFDRFPFIRSDSLDADYLFHVVFQLMMSNLSFWYEHRENCTLEELSQMSRALVCDGVAKYIDSRIHGSP